MSFIDIVVTFWKMLIYVVLLASHSIGQTIQTPESSHNYFSQQTWIPMVISKSCRICYEALDSATLAMSKACKKYYNSWNTYEPVLVLEPSTALCWTCTNLWWASQLQSYKTPDQYHGVKHSGWTQPDSSYMQIKDKYYYRMHGSQLLNCYIMEDILGLNLPKQQTSQLHSVQLYLHVTTLSKITNHTRWKLLHTKLQCPNSCNT